MAAKPLTSEAIALTEKKMDMTLDDIIKMSKTNTNKGSKQRVWNRSQNFSNKVSQDKNAKVRRFMDSRSSMRQGALAQRRTSFQGNQFPLTTEAARKAAVAPIRNKAFNQRRTVNVNKARVAQLPIQRKVTNVGGSNVKQPQQQQQPKQAPKQRPQTLDSLFANMKEERMKSLSQQHNAPAPRRNGGGQERMKSLSQQHYATAPRRNGGGQERMKLLSQQHYAPAPRRNGGGQSIVPWARGRFAR